MFKRIIFLLLILSYLNAMEETPPIYDPEELRTETPSLPDLSVPDLSVPNLSVLGSYEPIPAFSEEYIPVNKVIRIEFEGCSNVIAYDAVPFLLERVILFFGDNYTIQDKITSQLFIFDGYYTCISINDIRLSVRSWLPSRSLGGKASIRIRYPKTMTIDTLPILEYLRQQFRPATFICTD